MTSSVPPPSDETSAAPGGSDGTARGESTDPVVRGLERLGFAHVGTTRRGGSTWSLRFNRHLQFQVHDHADALVVTWSFDLAGFAAERGWQFTASDDGYAELFPARDSRVPRDLRAVEAEITRVLGTLRIDLGEPTA